MRIVWIGLTASEFCTRILEPDLENTFGEASLLRELFEIFGIRIVVQLKIGLHDAQLMMFERSSHPLLTLSSSSGSRGGRSYRYGVVVATVGHESAIGPARGGSCCSYRGCDRVGVVHVTAAIGGCVEEIVLVIGKVV